MALIEGTAGNLATKGAGTADDQNLHEAPDQEGLSLEVHPTSARPRLSLSAV